MSKLKFEFALVGNEIEAEVELGIENGVIASVETDAIYTETPYHCSGMAIPALANVHSHAFQFQCRRQKAVHATHGWPFRTESHDHQRTSRFRW